MVGHSSGPLPSEQYCKPCVEMILNLLQVIRQMRPWKEQSMMRMFLEEPPARTDAGQMANITNDSKVIQALQESLERLSTHARCYNEVRTFVEHILRFLHNIQLCPPGPSVGEQCLAHSTMRVFSIMDIAKMATTAELQPYFLLLSAHFEVLNLSFEFLNPWGHYDHLLHPKSLLIQEIYCHLLNVPGSRIDRKNCVAICIEISCASLMEVPYRLARNFMHTGRIGCLD